MQQMAGELYSVDKQNPATPTGINSMKSPLFASMQEALKKVKAGHLTDAATTLQQAFREKSKVAPTETTPPSPTPHAGLGQIFERVQEQLNAFQQRSSTVQVTPHQAADLPPNARFLTKTFSNQYGSRQYKLYIPSTYQDQPLPLIIMLHGCTQNPDDFALGTQMNELAEQHSLLIAYPEQPQSANPNRCWNWFKPQDQLAQEGEPSILAGITQTIMNEYLVKGQQVFIAGISAGGAMAAIMAARYPKLYRGVGIHSGLGLGSAHDLPSALIAMNRGNRPEGLQHFIPTIIFQGTQDKTVSPKNAEYLFEQAKTAFQQQTEHFELNTQRQQPQHSHAYTQTNLKNTQAINQIEYWQIEGLGHAWSGGDKSGSYTDPQGPKASAEMLRFFLAL